MKTIALSLVLSIWLLTVSGCGQPKPEAAPPPEPLSDKRADLKSEDTRWLTGTADSAMQRNAIIAQHTLYDYHFVPNAAQLNDLGLRDVGVLAAHFANHPGELSLRLKPESQQLFQSRMEAIKVELARAGVSMARMRLTTALPGGEGTPSRSVLTILDRQAQEPRGRIHTDTTKSSREVK